MMNVRKITFCVFQIACTFVFAITLNKTITRMMKNEQIQVLSIKTLDDIKLPQLVICNTNIFNFEKAKQLGFDGMSNFLAGINSKYPNSMVWVGNQDMSIKETFFEITKNQNYSTVEVKKAELRTYLAFNKGLCREVLNYSNSVAIKSKVDFSVFIIDPLKDTIDYRIMTGDSMDLSLNRDGLHLSKTFEVKIHQTQMAESSSCKTYEDGNSQYKCNMDTIDKKVIRRLGCELPSTAYFYNKSASCPGIVHNVSQDIRDEVHQLMLEYVNGMMRADCKDPCLRTTYEVNMVQNSGGYGDTHFIRIYFNNVVEYKEEQSNFDMFNVITDIGSNLSLWLSLSFLGILDIMMDMTQLIVTKLGIVETTRETK